MLDENAFRSRYPAFRSDQFPDSSVEIRLKLADKFFEGWEDGDVREHAMCLYVAHYLTAQGMQAAGAGGAASLGTVSGKSVDGASISYDTGSAVEQGAGFWNITSYGRELYQLLRVFGAGAIQL